VLELARRGIGGDTVALDPGGFWSPGELPWFSTFLEASLPLVLHLQWAMPALVGTRPDAPHCCHGSLRRPGGLTRAVALHEMRSLARAKSLRAALDALVDGPLKRVPPQVPHQGGSPSGT